MRKIIGIIVFIIGLSILVFGIINLKTEDKSMLNFVGKKNTDALFFANQYGLNLNITYEETTKYTSGIVIEQDIKPGTIVEEGQEFNIVVAR